MRKMLSLVIGRKTKRLTDGESEWNDYFDGNMTEQIVRKSSQLKGELMHGHMTDIETWNQKIFRFSGTGIFENR